jgi:hypothetical protein
MINKYYLRRNGWTEKIYQDSTSITNFNLKEKSESQTDLQNEATQDVYGNNTINNYAFERNEITITIKSQKNNFMQVWSLVTTLNTKNQIFNQQVTKIQKNLDYWILNIWDYVSFWKSILKRQ